MPSLLISNNRPMTTPTRAHLERQLAQGSIEAAYLLASATDYEHDMIQGCHKCDTIANYYLMGLRLAKNKELVDCNALLLDLVQQSIQLIMCHVDISRIRHLPWLPILMSELRDLGKHIKDESSEADGLVPLPEMDRATHPLCIDDSINGEYGRAIRISIYYCRAMLCEDLDTTKSISYYRKCLSVRSSPLETQKIQETAKLTLQHLIADGGQKYASYTNRPKLPSRTSSVSSGTSSSSSMACANCGVEKRGMPVCSKCKSQYYCGIRCLKIHKPVHELECCKSS